MRTTLPAKDLRVGQLVLDPSTGVEMLIAGLEHEDGIVRLRYKPHNGQLGATVREDRIMTIRQEGKTR